VYSVDVPEVYSGRRPGKDEPREAIRAEHEVEGDVVVGARSDNWLYEGDEIRDEHRLFDLRDGGFEQVASDLPEGSLVRQTVNQRLEELDVATRFLSEEVDGDVEGRLEKLGYL